MSKYGYVIVVNQWFESDRIFNKQTWLTIFRFQLKDQLFYKVLFKYQSIKLNLREELMLANSFLLRAFQPAGCTGHTNEVLATDGTLLRSRTFFIKRVRTEGYVKCS